MADVTLVCDDGEQFPCHRIVLTSASPRLDKILRKIKTESYVYMTGVNADLLKFILQFIYRGEAKVPNSQMEGFMKIAQDWKVEGLFETHKTNYEYESGLAEETKKAKANFRRDTEDYTINEVEEVLMENSLFSISTNQKESQGQYQCQLCGFETKGWNSLRKHMDTDHAVIEPKVNLNEHTEIINDDLVEEDETKTWKSAEVKRHRDVLVFKSSWLEQEVGGVRAGVWLRKDEEREGRGRCEFCKCSFKTNKGWSGVEQHSKTRKHVENMEQLLNKGQGGQTEVWSH